MSQNTYDKPFITYDEMIELLESRNIIVSDKSFTKQALSNFSYYSIINGYKNTFLTLQDSDNFIEGTKFKDLYYLNIIDADLNNILFKYILYIEKSLKSKLSYIISKSYGVYTNINNIYQNDTNDYLNPSYYSNSSRRRQNVIRKIKNCVKENEERNVIKHYIDNKNHLPPWIITNVIPFGLIINWYTILKRNDKTYVCENFISDKVLCVDEKKEFLIKSFKLSKEYRNMIAHGGKTVGVINLPRLPKKQLLHLSNGMLSEEEYNKNIGQNDTFSVFMIILILINDETLLRNFYIDVHLFFHKHKDSLFNKKNVYEVLKLPSDILHRMEEFIIKKLEI